jgi:hypothetical protein
MREATRNGSTTAEAKLEIELDALERLARRALPWELLGGESGAICSIMPSLINHKRRRLCVGLWWSALIVFGSTLGDKLDPDGSLSLAAVETLKETCPSTLDLQKTEPLIELMARYLSSREGYFNPNAFRAQARISAQVQIEHRRATLTKIREVRDTLAARGYRGRVIIHDLGGGWMIVTVDPRNHHDAPRADGVMFMRSADIGVAFREVF